MLTHLSQLLKLKKLTKPSVGDTLKETEELEFSYTPSGNVKQDNYSKNHRRWAPKSRQMVTAATTLKDACSLEEKRGQT